jgi:hypothetical protein
VLFIPPPPTYSVDNAVENLWKLIELPTGFDALEGEERLSTPTSGK